MKFLKSLLGNTEDDNEMEDIVIRDKDTGINIYSKKEEKKGMNNMNDLKYVVMTPNSFLESQAILNLIKEKRMITFSIEKLSREEGQRIVDIVSGARHAMNGKIVPVTDRVITYLPEGISCVNISNDNDE